MELRENLHNYTLNMSKEEMMTLRGIAWNHSGVVQAIVEAHQGSGTVPTDGPKDAETYQKFLLHVWSATNDHYRSVK